MNFQLDEWLLACCSLSRSRRGSLSPRLCLLAAALILPAACTLPSLGLQDQIAAGTVVRADETTRSGRLGAGLHTRSLEVGNRERRYRVYIPKSYAGGKATPVVLVFHGGGGDPDGMMKLCGLNAKAEQAGFIAVYPFGTGRFPDKLLTFNGGECCGYAFDNRVDDVGFVRALLDDLATVASVDADRVFATGLSNGGILSHYLASELSDRIAAIAPVGGPLMLEKPQNARGVPVLHFHGTKDEFAPFEGGFGNGFLGRNGLTKFRSVEHTVQSWIRANGCRPQPEVAKLPDRAEDGMQVTRRTWSGGRDGSEVVLIEIQGGGHTWPGQRPVIARLGESTMDLSANDLMWEFFQRHPRTGAVQNQQKANP